MDQLQSLLVTKPEAHRVSIRELCAVDADGLAVTLGPSWVADGQPLSLLIEGCREALFNAVHEPFTNVELLTTHPMLGDMVTLFGNAPLPDPPRFFFDFHRMCSRLGVAGDPSRYLNWQGSLGQWLEFVYSRSYRLLTAPREVAEGCLELLDAQLADYYFMPDPVAEPMQLLVLGPSIVVGKSVRIRDSIA